MDFMPKFYISIPVNKVDYGSSMAGKIVKSFNSRLAIGENINSMPLKIGYVMLAKVGAIEKQNLRVAALKSSSFLINLKNSVFTPGWSWMSQ